MLVIRLARIGKKNQPAFRVVLAEKGRSAKGKFIEILGNYSPRIKAKGLKAERIKYWISKGAQPSATMHNLLVSEKIIEGPKVKAWRPKKKTQEEIAASEKAATEAVAKKEAPAEEKPAEAPAMEEKKEEPKAETPAAQSAAETPAE